MIEKIVYEGKLLSIIITASFKKEGIEFFSPTSFSQQLGYMNRPVGYNIEPHIHNPVVREVLLTQEVLLIKSGKVRVDFYGEDKVYLESKILKKGDIILLAAGGHGFEMLEDNDQVKEKMIGMLEEMNIRSQHQSPEMPVHLSVYQCLN